ncbi:MAG: 4Fe-4S binding protein [Spirochaetaceae bacterium]|nr:MAG: 4Fe-4S binding protein [Spirochaetaceae bacterium]
MILSPHRVQRRRPSDPPDRRAGKLPRIMLALMLTLFLIPGSVSAQDRIPRPEFQSDYQIPEPTIPTPREGAYEYLDTVVLLICLILATLFALKVRSRTALFLLMMFSLIYFGFWRQGCVCPIGAIQNVVLVLSDSSYRIPLVVVAFFTLPLVFALFFGRTFCAAVCPLGGLQDLVVLRPLRVPRWLSRPLSMIPYLYLGIAVLTVATGAGFLICRFDPFVGIFRRSAPLPMVLFGGGLLALGTVIPRPYCRFLCPYSVLLRWLSRFSRWHLRISPEECIQCRLCEGSCPFDVIQKPTEQPVAEKTAVGMRRLLILLLLLPVLIFAGGFTGSRLSVPLSQLHATVRLAETIFQEDAEGLSGTTLDSEAFRGSERTTGELLDEALLIRSRVQRGALVAGALLSLAFAVSLIRLSLHRRREEYEPDRAECFSCGRCIEHCVMERVRRAEPASKVEA